MTSQSPFQELYNKLANISFNMISNKFLISAVLNIPLLEAIKEVPKYAKYLKDICTVKRTLRVKKKYFLVQNITALVQDRPLKCKDPGAHTIPCRIGETKFSEALLDLVSSVNLFPYHIYTTLGLGELEPTACTLTIGRQVHCRS